MEVTLYNLKSEFGLKKLDEYLLTGSYISGYQASKDDLTVYAALPSVPSDELMNVTRWYKHIDTLLRLSGVSGEGFGVTVESSLVAEEPADTKTSEKVLVTKYTDKYEEASIDIQTLKAEVKTLQHEKSTLETRFVGIMLENSIEIQTLKAEVQTLQQHKSALKSRAVGTSTEIQTLKAEVETLRQDNSALESRAIGTSIEIQTLNAEVKAL
ncbi:hypothetical protein TSUD_274750 [Trifolium subterraneum]|uniref:Translation elongation factor EF1B beta/delta subunit guanine nucleotide exchange domain-containing protein n=1 Tax=Trifolium subterraneum TaxID=3900 RepID=A0A2Z6MZL1_TRISU|nr:hypothetical protein TSUD_274750 [Trifolium subterraneum]